MIRAWHFTAGPALANGDNRPIVCGEWLTVEPPIVACKRGLHASVLPLDALRYAPGSWVWRVECDGEIVEHDGDKIACPRRRALWGYDAEPVLLHFARLCALDVIHLWSPPEIVVRYLRTGDESIRAAAWAAARAAARDAAWAAARDAAWAAAWDAQNRRLARMLAEGRP